MATSSVPSLRSRAQHRRLQALVAEGKFPASELSTLEASTDLSKLPERVVAGPKGGRNIGSRLPAGPGSQYDRAARAKLY